MTYKTLYRQWRPKTFDEIMGQDHVVRTLKNALGTNKIAHAYLLCGPRGTGKTTTAKLIAKTLNCRNVNEGEPCNVCSNCELINSGSSLDVVEIDGASNRGIDEIRDLREKVSLAPVEGSFKVYIIDEVHMLTGEAFNALLKTLEEPPAHVVFIMATTEPHKIPATVLSRCQRFDFKRLSIEEIVGQMTKICRLENIPFEDDALYTIARFAGGGMRDALSILDQCLSFGSGKLFLEDVRQVIGIVDYGFLQDFVDGVIEGNFSKALYQIDRLVAAGKDVGQFTWQLLDYLRDLLLIKVCGSSELLQVPQSEINRLMKQSKKASKQLITSLMDNLAAAEKDMKWNNNDRLLLELAVVKLDIKEKEDKSLQELEKRLRRLEERIESGEPSYQKPVKKERKNVSSPSTTNLNLEKIKMAWEDFLQAIKKNKITTYAFLVEARPLCLKNGVLILGVRKGCEFHRDKLKESENNEIIAKTFKDFFGAEVRVEVQLLDEEMAVPPATYEKVNTKETTDDDSIVKEAIKLFGGNVVKIID